MLFISSEKLFSFSRYLSFCHDFQVMQEKRLDQKDQANFKIHDFRTWLTNNCNTHIAQYLTKKGNQTMKLSLSIKYNKRKMRQGDQFQTTFYFLKKLLILGKSNWSAAQFKCILIALNLACNKNKLYKTLDYLTRDMLNVNFSEKGLELVSPPHFVHDFSMKMFFMLHSIN